MLIRPTGHSWHILNRIQFRANIALFIFFWDMGDVGAADKAAIQRVRVSPYQLLVSDT